MLSTPVHAVDPPYPPSDFITDIQIGNRIYQGAQGSDNWPMTWADDGHIYTTYGDGHGFSPRPNEKLSMGFARLEGNPPDVTGINILSDDQVPAGDGANGEKASGILFIDGRLYAWARNADNDGNECRLLYSDDYAQNWTWANWQFSELGYCAFLNFGQNYQGARDTYVYMYSANTRNAYNETDNMVLTRVPKDQILNRSAYEFFSGSASTPSWSSTIGSRTSVFNFNDGVNRLDVSYNPGIARYLLTMRSRGRGGGENHFSIYEAPEPWGPWRTVYFEENAGTTNQGWGEVAHIPTKWISADGKTIHIAYAGDDSLSIKRATLIINGSVPPTPTPNNPLPTNPPSGNTIADPLTNGLTVATQVGGTFNSAGWTSTSEQDKLMYTLPADATEGSITFNVFGIDLDRADPTNESRRHFFGLYDTLKDAYIVKEESCQCNGFTIRIYHGDYEDHPSGETRLRLDGAKYSKKQGDSGPHEWNNTNYTIKFEWTQTRATWYRDGVEMGSVEYPNINTPFRYLYLNNDNHNDSSKNFPGLRAATYSNVVITHNGSPSGTGCNKTSGDVDCSGSVNIFDLSILLRNFGTNNAEADVDGSGAVNIFDLSILLRNFGS